MPASPDIRPVSRRAAAEAMGLTVLAILTGCRPSVAHVDITQPPPEPTPASAPDILPQTDVLPFDADPAWLDDPTQMLSYFEGLGVGLTHRGATPEASVSRVLYPQEPGVITQLVDAGFMHQDASGERAMDAFFYQRTDGSFGLQLVAWDKAPNSPEGQTILDGYLVDMVATADGGKRLDLHKENGQPVYFGTQWINADGTGSIGFSLPDTQPAGTLIQVSYGTGEFPTPTPPPEATPIPEPSFEQQMQEAIASGKESFTTLDPDKAEVVVDVPSVEMIGDASWDWKYRAFTKLDENGIRYVLRHPGEGWMWLEVLDEWDLTDYGWGVWTLEGERAALATGNGGIKTPIRNPRFDKRQEVLDGLLRFMEAYYGQNPVISYPEIDNFSKYRSGGVSNVPDDLPNENMNFRGGVAIYMDAEFGNSLLPEESGPDPINAWNAQAEAGRPLLTEYQGYLIYQGEDVTAINLTHRVIDLLRWLSGPPTEAAIEAVMKGGGSVTGAGLNSNPEAKKALSVFFGTPIDKVSRETFIFTLILTD